MIRRILPLFVIAVVIAAFALTLGFLYQKSLPVPPKYELLPVQISTIWRKAVVPGSIVPRKEIVVKPRVSGVIEKLYVEPGQVVKAKDPIAKIRIIPNVVALNSAEARVQAALINFENAKAEFARFKRLYEEKLINETDYVQRDLAFNLKKQELEAANANLELVREGAAKSSGLVSNVVLATLPGTVLDVPVKLGSSVIEANNFNEGTTIASVADMTDLIFQGRVDELEVGRLSAGMPVAINIGALSHDTLQGKLDYIATKGKDKDGSIEFEVRATVSRNTGILLRAAYSANADIVLDERKDVLAVDESAIQFDKDKTFVELELAANRFERREVKLGLSDGVLVEVVSGLEKGQQVKKQQADVDLAKQKI